MNKTTIDSDTLEALRLEYSEAGENWRFFISTRFITLGSFVTLHVVIFTVIGFGKDTSLDPDLLWTLASATGVLVTLAVSMMEFRSYRLFQICLDRAIEIENLLGLTNGHYHLFKASEGKSADRRFVLATHTRAFALLYTVAFLFWAGMVLFYGEHALLG